MCLAHAKMNFKTRRVRDVGNIVAFDANRCSARGFKGTERTQPHKNAQSTSAPTKDILTFLFHQYFALLLAERL